MPPRKSSSRNDSFVERHGLWAPEQERAATAVERAIRKHKLDLVRFSFVDQHGTLRGKTLMAADAARAMRSGVTMTTTLLAKVGVTVEMAATRGALALPILRAYSRLETIIAAPPSLVAQMSIRRSGSATMADAATSSAV